jgi:hypothetical protein
MQSLDHRTREDTRAGVRVCTFSSARSTFVHGSAKTGKKPEDVVKDWHGKLVEALEKGKARSPSQPMHARARERMHVHAHQRMWGSARKVGEWGGACVRACVRAQVVVIDLDDSPPLFGEKAKARHRPALRACLPCRLAAR